MQIILTGMSVSRNVQPFVIDREQYISVLRPLAVDDHPFVVPALPRRMYLTVMVET